MSSLVIHNAKEMAMTPRYKQRTESLPNALHVMFGNGQVSPEDNPNHLVYKKVSLLTVGLLPNNTLNE